MHEYCKTCVKEAGCLDKNDPEDSCGWYEKSAAIDDGGSAFPIPNSDLAGSYHPSSGMTLRDWFAGMALQSLPHWGNENPAVEAYKMADKMIAARDYK